MKQKMPLLFIFSVLILSGCSSQGPVITPLKDSTISIEEPKPGVPVTPPPSPHIEEVKPVSSHTGHHLPPMPRDALEIKNGFFRILYSKSRNIAYYSEYELTAEHLRAPKVKRKDAWHVDPELMAQGLTVAEPRWYSHSGYDKGHLAPSADFAWSREANYSTFTTANATPQSPGLNRQAWEALEVEVRKWACGEGEVEVMTGPILEKNLPDFNGHPMPIPRRFFKVIIHKEPPTKAIAFIMNQDEVSKQAYKSDVVTVSEVEKETGLQLVPDNPTHPTLKTHSSLNEWKEANCEKPKFRAIYGR